MNTDEPPTGATAGATGGPYVGPRPFRASEASLFFGRHAEARDIRSLWLTEPLVVVHGRAGAGKTSLINAGVVAVLAGEERVDLLPVGRLAHQSSGPFPAEHADKGYRNTLLSSWAPFTEPAEAGTTVRNFLAARRRSRSAAGRPLSMLAAIDHFEELFTAFPASDTQCDQFIGELAEALRETEDLHLLLIIRDDHLPTLNRYMARLALHPPTYQAVRALEVKAAMEAVTGPLATTTRRFAPGVAEKLIERLRTFSFTNMLSWTTTLKNDWIEPLDLQITCASLWSALPDDVEVVTDENLQAFGDPGQAAAEFYDRAVNNVSQWQAAVDEADLRRWIESTFVTERGTRGTALRGITMTGGMPNSIADAFADLRILAAEYRNQGTWYQLAQDRLIEAVRSANRVRYPGRGALPSGSTTITAADLRAGAEAAFATGDFAGAQNLIEAALESYRVVNNPRGLAHTLELQGEIARVGGDLETAERSFHSALFEFSSLGDAAAEARLLSTLGDIIGSVGDYKKAVQYHQQASDRLPASVEVLTRLGYAQWHCGSPSDAAATFSRALDWNRNEAEALAGRGQVRAELGAYPEALVDLDRAIMLGLAPSSEIDARSARAVALANVGQDEDADRELQTARSSDPGRPLTQLRAGRVAAFRGQTERARDELEHALRAQPPLPPRDVEVARELLKRLSRVTDPQRGT